MILSSSAFADRPVKESAYELLFHRAMEFAPYGEYWRNQGRWEGWLASARPPPISPMIILNTTLFSP
jgi:hypothetical protein